MALTQQDLAQFTGTFHYYQSILPSIQYTDGVRFVAVEGEAFWLIDKIASLQLDPKIRAEEFQAWTLTVADKNGELVCDDGNGNVVHREAITYTDFPLPEIKMWLTGNTILLPSEY